MGACGSASKQEVKQDKEIAKFLKDEKKKMDEEVKLLLLGAGESGKSTIAKQMKILHLEGFSAEERLTYKSIIYNNVLSSMKALIQACQDLNIALEETPSVAFVRNYDYGDPFTTELAGHIKTVWADKNIQSAYERQAEFQLNDSAAYYFNAIDRVGEQDYVPSEQDVLRSRARTAGIIETEFVVEKTKFKLVDVGGQRSERKKWMHCFQEVTSVIFCVALSEFDLKLFEDDTTNRMQESLRLFREICNSKWFVETSMILFLNKKDLFEQKVQKVDLSVCFPDYKGGKNMESAKEFIRDKFLAQNENSKKHIYVHFTCATDTGNVKVVFNAVKDIVLHKVLDDSGLGF